MAERYPRETPRIIEAIPYERTIPYSSSPDVSLPRRPQTDMRPGGFLGLGINLQDESHHRRMIEIYYVGLEAALAGQMGNAVELNGMKHAVEAMRKAEEIVYSQSPDAVAGMLAADMAGDIAARMRARHARLVEAYEAEATNILNRR